MLTVVDHLGLADDDGIIQAFANMPQVRLHVVGGWNQRYCRVANGLPLVALNQTL
jgi:hypothetical protein